jgi:hypothetical protein
MGAPNECCHIRSVITKLTYLPLLILKIFANLFDSLIPKAVSNVNLYLTYTVTR